MARPRPWHDRRVVITAGPTREHLDRIRFLSNASTGRMGIELARTLARRGAEVVLVLGPTTLSPPAGVEVVDVVSTQDLLRATRTAAADAQVVVFAAAPSDYRPARRLRGKPAREAGGYALDLVPTEDVAAALGKRKKDRLHVGFALEVAQGATRARRKVARKNLDAIVLNGPANFGTGGGEARWIPRHGEIVSLETRSKAVLARGIVAQMTALLNAR